MRLNLLFAALLCLAALSSAYSVKPDYLGIKDTGNQSLPKMDITITLDCDTKAATISVSSNDTGLPVQGAKTYMFYTDYGYNALPNPGTTDALGMAVMNVTGNIRYLTALFVLRTDDPAFQSREIEFTYQKCFSPPPPPAPLPQNQSNGTLVPPAQNNTTSTNVTAPPNTTIPANATPTANGTPLANASNNGSGTNQTGGGQKAPSACPLPAALLALIFLKARY